jgi:hypothetical protein
VEKQRCQLLLERLMEMEVWARAGVSRVLKERAATSMGGIHEGHEGFLFVYPHTLLGSLNRASPCFERDAPLPRHHPRRFLPDRLENPRTKLGVNLAGLPHDGANVILGINLIVANARSLPSCASCPSRIVPP